VLVERDGVLAGFIGSPVETKSTLRESASGVLTPVLAKVKVEALVDNVEHVDASISAVREPEFFL